MDTSKDSLEKHLPYYLTQDAKDNLTAALKAFPNVNYYLDAYNDTVLQGDCWNCLEVIDFKSLTKRSVKGIVLSNTCDVSPENSRDLPVRLTFVPIIKLSSYGQLLQNQGVAEEKLASKIQAIIDQRITSMIYFPKGGGLDEDYVALLDDMHSIPSDVFFKQQQRKKIFTLSQIGYYLFIFKLSIHFCRFHDKVIRDEGDLKSTEQQAATSS